MRPAHAAIPPTLLATVKRVSDGDMLVTRFEEA